MKYVNFLLKGSEELKKQDADGKAKVAASEMQLLITKKEVELSKAEQAVHESKGKDPFNPGLVLDNLNNVDLQKREIKQLKEIQEELFGAVK